MFVSTAMQRNETNEAELALGLGVSRPEVETARSASISVGFM